MITSTMDETICTDDRIDDRIDDRDKLVLNG